MTARSPIGLSCGHRVARSNRGEYGQGYWCPACRVWRLSGRVGTGEHAFDGFKLLAELTDGLEVDFKGLLLADYQLALLNTLGVEPANFRRQADGDELADRRTRRRRDHREESPFRR